MKPIFVFLFYRTRGPGFCLSAQACPSYRLKYPYRDVTYLHGGKTAHTPRESCNNIIIKFYG